MAWQRRPSCSAAISVVPEPANGSYTRSPGRVLLRRQWATSATGFAVGFTTDDCRKTYETLVERGVEFTQEPTEQFYGIDIGIRDPFGNHIRIVQPAPVQQQTASRATT